MNVEELNRIKGEALAEAGEAQDPASLDAVRVKYLGRKGLLPEVMKKLKGLGTAKAAILVAAFELTKRALNEGNGALPSVSSPSDVLPLIADIRTKRKEHFVAIYLNARNQIIHREEISVGSLSASIVHPREVFQPAVEVSAASLILAHNHPSGDVLPSKDDVEITKRMAEAGKIMGIEVLDHIIIGAERFLSLKEKSVIR